MSLVINDNLMAVNTARNLNIYYGKLQTSTQRLSSGLRINSAADDAAGLAIRELMRADVAALNQGVRNANDAISMIQVADGALAVIDEKLIRMKELAEQAATGTYNSTQRLMIESEYQAMASEVTRIANATDFNGIKLLDGSLSGMHDGSALNSSGKMKIHFGSANNSAEDYYYIEIGNCTAAALGIGNSAFKNESEYIERYTIIENGVEIELTRKEAWVTLGDPLPANPQPSKMYELYEPAIYYQDDIGKWMSLLSNAEIPPPTGPLIRETAGGMNYADMFTDGVAAGGHTYWKGNYVKPDGRYVWNIFESDIQVSKSSISQKVYADGFTISTQEAAQKSLEAIDNAIVSKDKIRAHLGALQNRLENTISNLEIQAENLQAAESRISDIDVATEMTNLVRNQILTQSAVAMLSQANLLPQMAMRLIGG